GNPPSATTPAGSYQVRTDYPGSRDYTAATGTGTDNVGVNTNTTTPPGTSSGSGSGSGGSGGGGGSGSGGGSSSRSGPGPVSYLQTGAPPSQRIAVIDGAWWTPPAVTAAPSVTLPDNEGYADSLGSVSVSSADAISAPLSPDNAALKQ